MGVNLNTYSSGISQEAASKLLWALIEFEYAKLRNLQRQGHHVFSIDKRYCIRMYRIATGETLEKSREAVERMIVEVEKEFEFHGLY